MNKLGIPLLLLNLTKQENQLLILLFLIHDKPRKDKYTLKEISTLASISRDVALDVLNKLVIKNIIGKIRLDGIINPTVLDNFDHDFLVTLYNQNDALNSAKQRAGFIIDDIDTFYLLNTATKSWKYAPKSTVVRTLKKLKKISDDEFVDYLLNSFESKVGNKRKQSNLRLNGWNVHEIVELFRSKYRAKYGKIYHADKRDYGHMKKLLVELSANNIHKDNVALFFDYALDKALSRDYVLQIFGLRYYTNEFTGTKNAIKSN